MKLENYHFFFLLYLLSLNVKSQEKNEPVIKEKSAFWNNVRYGGGIGLDFSNNRTSVNISPSAIYQVNEKFSTGTAINFGYSSFKINNAKQFNYGLSFINLYNPLKELQISGEFEYTFVNQSFKDEGMKFTDDFSFPSLFIGAGYSLGHFSAGLRYDLLYNENRSIYSSALIPFARVYF